MNLTADRLAQRFAAELGADSVASDPAQILLHKLDGQLSALLCRPANEAQLSTALRLCAEHDAAVIPWGGGTAMTVGNVPRQIDVVISTERLARIIDHDHANLTVTAESGVVLARLQNELTKRHQFAPLEAPFPDCATIGGIIAANLNGPRRSYYGSVRDLVIGIRVVLMSGEQIKAGGKVVKNVAGYDMCKLFVGSLGTLGVINEATLRLAPRAESAMTMIADGTFEQARQFAAALDRSPVLPTATLLSKDRDQETWRLAVRCEGFSEMIERSRSDLAALAAQSGMNAEFPSSDEQDEFWRAAQNLSLQSGRLIF